MWAIPDQRGIYVVDTTFAEAGDWGAEFTTTPPGTPAETIRVRVPGLGHELGDPPSAPRRRPRPTPTAADVGGDLGQITTDPNPDPSFYQISVHEALAQHKPFVLVFATPTFCTSQQCGPTLDAVKDSPRPSRASPSSTSSRTGSTTPTAASSRSSTPRQPPADRRHQRVGPPSEPWIFVVDRNGIVQGSYSVIITPAELKAAVAAATK